MNTYECRCTQVEISQGVDKFSMPVTTAHLQSTSEVIGKPDIRIELWYADPQQYRVGQYYEVTIRGKETNNAK